MKKNKVDRSLVKDKSLIMKSESSGEKKKTILGIVCFL